MLSACPTRLLLVIGNIFSHSEQNTCQSIQCDGSHQYQRLHGQESMLHIHSQAHKTSLFGHRDLIRLASLARTSRGNFQVSCVPTASNGLALRSSTSAISWHQESPFFDFCFTAQGSCLHCSYAHSSPMRKTPSNCLSKCRSALSAGRSLPQIASCCGVRMFFPAGFVEQ